MPTDSAAQNLSIENGLFHPPASYSPLAYLRVITAHPKGCAWILTEIHWAEIKEKIDEAMERAPDNVAGVALKRVIISNGTPLETTTDGRIKVPQVLLDFSGISDQVVWVPTESGVRLWSPEKFARHAVRPT